jgi:hypothetical protein
VASDPDRFASTLDSWLDYYNKQGIESIGIGAVVLRRRTGAANWVSTAELARGPVGSSGGHIERIFTAQDFLAAGDNTETLLAQSFRLVEDHRLEQILSYRDGAYIAEDAVIVLEDGIGLRNRVPAQALHILLRMDGSRRLRELIEEAAHDTGLDPRTLSPGVVECVRELFRLGLIFRDEST